MPIRYISAYLFNLIHLGPMALESDPMNILGDAADSSLAKGGTTSFVNKTGLGQLGAVVTTGFTIAAVITILGALITLLVVNYPKTVAQTKTKVAHSFFVIILLDGLILIMNAIVYVIEYGLGMK